jgi:hypothetical protein
VQADDVMSRSVLGAPPEMPLRDARLRLDAEIVRAIREDILQSRMWIDPDSLGVTVREGIVRLAGKVDRRSTARIIEKLAGQVDGVSQVVPSLSWDLDDRETRPPAVTARKPGAASLIRREHPQLLHR